MATATSLFGKYRGTATSLFGKYRGTMVLQFQVVFKQNPLILARHLHHFHLGNTKIFDCL